MKIIGQKYILILSIFLFLGCKQETYQSRFEVFTSEISTIELTTATINSNISYDEVSEVLERGICWDSFPNPTLKNHNLKNGKGFGPFVNKINGLTEFTDYYVRSYAITKFDTIFSAEKTFKTAEDFIKRAPCKPKLNTFYKNTLSYNYFDVNFGRNGFSMYGLGSESEIWVSFDHYPVSGKYTTVKSYKDLTNKNCFISARIGLNQFVGNAGDTVYLVNDDNKYSLVFCNTIITQTTGSTNKTYISSAYLQTK